MYTFRTVVKTCLALSVLVVYVYILPRVQCNKFTLYIYTSLSDSDNNIDYILTLPLIQLITQPSYIPWLCYSSHLAMCQLIENKGTM